MGKIGIASALFLGAGDAGCHEKARQNKGKRRSSASVKRGLQPVEMLKLSL
jgi:hypothetical protein